MSWSHVGFLTSLVPWAIVSLVASGAVCVPCRGMEADLLKCLWCVAAAFAVLACLAGLRRRVAVGWAVAGLALGFAVGVPMALSEPAMAGAVAVPTAATVFALTQWR